MNKIKVIRAILFILIIGWAFLVFGLSGQTGGESSNLSRRIAELFTKDKNIIGIVEFYIRKLAHFSEYGLGGVLFFLLFYTYEWSEKRKMLTSIILGIWYAITDEVHQLMVDGRSGNIVDVYIDTLGFSTGVCVTLLLIKIILLIRESKKNKQIKIKEVVE